MAFPADSQRGIFNGRWSCHLASRPYGGTCQGSATSVVDGGLNDRPEPVAEIGMRYLVGDFWQGRQKGLRRRPPSPSSRLVCKAAKEQKTRRNKHMGCFGLPEAPVTRRPCRQPGGFQTPLALIEKKRNGSGPEGHLFSPNQQKTANGFFSPRLLPGLSTPHQVGRGWGRARARPTFERLAAPLRTHRLPGHPPRGQFRNIGDGPGGPALDRRGGLGFSAIKFLLGLRCCRFCFFLV